MQTLFIRDGRRFREATPEEIFAVSGVIARSRRKASGGPWSNMTPEQRSERAKKMAEARWRKIHGH